MIVMRQTERYEGRVISHFEDEYGNKLKNLVMTEFIKICFVDGTAIKLGLDWRGAECYMSQKL